MNESPPPPQRPDTDDPDTWHAYWKAQGQEWRTAPEIDIERQGYLEKRVSDTGNVSQEQHHFQDISLHHADVEWLLARHLEKYPERNTVTELGEGRHIIHRRLLLDLSGADLHEVDLSALPLKHIKLNEAHLEGADLQGAHLEEAHLEEAHLERADLSGAHLERANLEGAYLERAHLEGAHLEEARLVKASMEEASLGLGFTRKYKGADLSKAHLEEANLNKANLRCAILSEAHLEGAGLQGAHLEEAHLEEAHLEAANLSGAYLGGANLNEADLRKAVLNGAHLIGRYPSIPINRYIPMMEYIGSGENAKLEGANLSEAHLKGADLSEVRLDKANLSKAHLEDADLSEAHLEGADLQGAYLERATLSKAHLEDADLSEAHLEGAKLSEARMEKTNLRGVHLEGSDLSGAFFTSETNLEGIILGNKEIGYASLAGIRWGDVDLSIINWAEIKVLGDEREARQEKRNGQVKDRVMRLREYEKAARANLQLSVALRSQGLTKNANHFAYRAQVLQRTALGLQILQPDAEVRQRIQSLGVWLLSWFLFLLAGYGYTVWRSFAAYVLVIAGFATAYYLFGVTDIGPHHVFGPHHLFWYEAIVVSMFAFHGRGFFSGTFSPGDPQALVAAIEAFVGLIIEISFIATFTRRFLGG